MDSPHVRAIPARRHRSPEVYVRWLVHLASGDAATWTDGDWRAAYSGLFALLYDCRWGKQPLSPQQRQVAQQAHQQITACLNDLANGRPHTHCPRHAVDWAFTPPTPRRPGARTSHRILRRNDAEGVDPVSALVFRTIDLLDEVGADRLKACPFADGGRPCDRLFLARRRQVYCSKDHARRASWAAYIARGGTPARKLGRHDETRVPVRVPASTGFHPKPGQRQPATKRKTPR